MNPAVLTYITYAIAFTISLVAHFKPAFKNNGIPVLPAALLAGALMGTGVWWQFTHPHTVANLIICAATVSLVASGVAKLGSDKLNRIIDALESMVPIQFQGATGSFKPLQSIGEVGMSNALSATATSMPSLNGSAKE